MRPDSSCTLVEAEASRTLPQARAMLRTLRSDDEAAALLALGANLESPNRAI